MSFRINTNVAAMNAMVYTTMTARDLENSLGKLSSGLRINSAADDSSGMAIADSLRADRKALSQAIDNANDGIGIVQIADKAMDEQIKIAERIKILAIQAAQDGQTLQSREALQKEAFRLREEYNNIALNTSYNGKKLLSGSFTNKEFQVGSNSNNTINFSIGATQSAKSAGVNYSIYNSQAYHNSAAIPADFDIGFIVNGKTITLQSATMGTSSGEGLGAVADIINRYSDLTGVRAVAEVEYISVAGIGQTNISSIQAGSLPSDFAINGVTIGALDVQDGDNDGVLVDAINRVSIQTGVRASTTPEGQLVLTTDGRAISVEPHHAGGNIVGDVDNYFGNLKLIRDDGRVVTVSADMQASLDNFNIGGGAAITAGNGSASESQYYKNLDDIDLTGMLNIEGDLDITGSIDGRKFNSLKDAIMDSIDIAEAQISHLNTIRSDLGSVQNQFISTINNISVMQVTTAQAESQIRNLDFAQESAKFSKKQVLMQSGSYALSQANKIQSNVIKLLL